MGRKVVTKPLLIGAQELHVTRADFLFEFAASGFLRRFAAVNAALWHLPSLHRLVDALPDENQAFAVEQHDTHAGTIGKVLVFDVKIVARHGNRSNNRREYRRSPAENKVAADGDRKLEISA